MNGYIPDHPDVLSTRGKIYIAMERWTEAITDLAESVKLRKNSKVVHCFLEKGYTGLSEPQMAERHRQRAEELEAAHADGDW